MTDSGTTLTSDLKGGDAVQIGGRVREVFDTYPTGHGATMVRFLDDAGEVKALRTFANDSLLRLPAECIEISRAAAGR